MSANNQNLHLFSNIMHGYSFRNTIAIIKSETDKVTFIFSKDKIEISFVNNSACAIYCITLYTKEFTKYEFSVSEEENNNTDCYAIGLETSEIYNAVKGIGRKDGIIFYKMKGDKKLYVMTTSATSKDLTRKGAVFVNIENIEHTKVEKPKGYSKTPSVRIPAKEFSTVCGQINTLKCRCMSITGKKTTMILNGLSTNNKVVSQHEFGAQQQITYERHDKKTLDFFDSIDVILNNSSQNKNNQSQTNTHKLNIIKKSDEIMVKLPLQTIRSISKIHNISPDGTVLKFYFEPNLPIKIKSPIGTYGKLILCARDWNPQK